MEKVQRKGPKKTNKSALTNWAVSTEKSKRQKKEKPIRLKKPRPPDEKKKVGQEERPRRV